MTPSPLHRSLGHLLALGLMTASASAAAEDVLEFSLPRLSGFVQPDFSWSPDDEEQAGEAFLRRLQVRASGDLGTKALGYTVSVELAKPRRPLRDAYVSVRVQGQELRLGQFKVPFGWEVPLAVTQMPTIEYSVTEQLAIGRDQRDIGLGLFGTNALGNGWELENGVAIVNGEGANTADATPKKDVFGRIGLLRGTQLRVGVSAASVEFKGDEAVERSTRLGADLGVGYGPVRLLAEYVRGRYMTPEQYTAHAFYGTAVLHAGLGIDLLGRYEQLIPGQGEDARLQYATVGANYTHARFNARLQANYRRGLLGTEGNLLLVQAQYVF